jgi:hypothetical protein
MGQIWYDVQIVIPEPRNYTAAEIAAGKTADGKSIMNETTITKAVLK